MLELIRALAIAWKNLAAYPAGHPALAASMALAHRRLVEIFGSSGAVTLGVARDGLLCGQEKVTSSHARDLARALYLREVALLRLEPGMDAAELEALLRLVAADSARADAPPLAEEIAAGGLTHARVETVDFSKLRVTDDMSDEGPPPTLWDDLLQAILAGHELSPEGRHVMESGEAATSHGLSLLMKEIVARAEEGGGAAAAAHHARLGESVSQVVGRHFSGASAQRMMAANQIAELVRAMPEGVREAVVAAAVRALASDEAAAEALAILAGSVAPDTILQALRQIKEEVPLSTHALRLLHALSAAAPAATAPRVEEPDAALIAELSVLFLEDDVDRYNPEEHKALLAEVALEVPDAPPAVADLGERMASLTDDVVGDHMAQASIEMLGRIGGKREGTGTLLARLEGVFRDGVARGQVEASVALAEDLKALAEEAPLRAVLQAQVDETLARMAAAESLRALLDAINRRGTVSPALARRLMDALGDAATHGFLVALAEEQDKSRRRRLLDMLVSLGPAIAAPAREMLGDIRWYVVRNMLVILQRVGDRDSLPRVRLCASAHPDLRVRLEAIKFLLAIDPEPPREMLARAIHDPDPKMAEAAVTLAGSYGIKEAVDPLLEVVDGWDLLRRREHIRVKALKSLGELADPATLPRLERYFRNWILPVVSLAERRAAFRSLQSYPPAERAPFIERGARSNDHEIRRICLGLLRGRKTARRGAAAEA